MQEISVLEVQLAFPDGRKQELTIDAEFVVVGSGAHCEVRLSAEDAAPEQLEVRVSDAGCFARVRSFERPVFLDGVRFDEGPLPPSGVLEIGSVRMRLALGSSSKGEARRSHGTKGNRAIHMLAVVGFPLGFSLLLGARSREGTLPEPVTPPALFAARSEPCKAGDPITAGALGERLFRLAEGERERAPFHAESGVRAVRSFEQAAECLRLTDQAARAEEAARVALELRREVENEFAVHRVRLERALDTKHYETARQEIARLLAFLGKNHSEYREWLWALDRNLELKFSGRKKNP